MTGEEKAGLKIEIQVDTVEEPDTRVDITGVDTNMSERNEERSDQNSERKSFNTENDVSRFWEHNKQYPQNNTNQRTVNNDDVQIDDRKVVEE